MLFDCSRTIVREALMRLAARGIVTVSARRGWYVMRALAGRGLRGPPRDRVRPDPLRRWPAGSSSSRAHLAREKGRLIRSYLLGDFPRVPGRMPGQQPAGRHAARLHRAHHADAVPVVARAAQRRRSGELQRRGPVQLPAPGRPACATLCLAECLGTRLAGRHAARLHRAHLPRS
jgi:hypothetical protein